MITNFNSMYWSLLEQYNTDAICESLPAAPDPDAAASALLTVGGSLYSIAKYKLFLKRFINNAYKQIIEINKEKQNIQAIKTAGGVASRQDFDKRAKFNTKINVLESSITKWLKAIEPYPKGILFRDVNLYRAQLNSLLEDLADAKYKRLSSKGKKFNKAEADNISNKQPTKVVQPKTNASPDWPHGPESSLRMFGMNQQRPAVVVPAKK